MRLVTKKAWGLVNPNHHLNLKKSDTFRNGKPKSKKNNSQNCSDRPLLAQKVPSAWLTSMLLRKGMGFDLTFSGWETWVDNPTPVLGWNKELDVETQREMTRRERFMKKNTEQLYWKHKTCVYIYILFFKISIESKAEICVGSPSKQLNTYN